MRELYKTVEKIIDGVNFEKIWQGFSKFNFALYDNKNVYFKDEVISYDNRFLGNTSINYNGEFIAIWYVEDPQKEDSQILAADLVHEMFHAFQDINGEKRYPDDLTMLNYPDNLENYKTKHAENLLLAEAYLSDDLSIKKELIQQFISLRKHRENIIGEILTQEYLTETFEGLAEYVGSMALKQISHEKYVTRVDGFIKSLKTMDNHFFDMRKMSYQTGAIFYIVLSRVGVDIFHKIGTTKEPIFSLVTREITADSTDKIFPVNFDTNNLAEKLTKHVDDKKAKFDDFFKNPTDKIAGDYFICGYDPMNMIKMENMILCSHFVMLQDKNIVNAP